MYVKLSYLKTITMIMTMITVQIKVTITTITTMYIMSISTTILISISTWIFVSIHDAYIFTKGGGCFNQNLQNNRFRGGLGVVLPEIP